MTNSFNNFRGGVRFLDLSSQVNNGLPGASAEDPWDSLGPLKALRGSWKGAPNDGWNIISIPGKGSFKFEVIPYSEVLNFNPKILVGADNVGRMTESEENIQQLFGLMYEQIINSSCEPVSPEPEERKLPNGGTIPANFERKCKFKNGDTIHAETGFFLHTAKFNTILDITRLSTIPHGNSVLQLGRSTYTNIPITDSSFIGEASSIPTPICDDCTFTLAYTDPINGFMRQQFPDFPAFNQVNPNSALHSGLMYHTKDGLKNKTILEMTTLDFSTEYEKAGILNIPFLQQNVEATKMTATFWIQKIKGESDSIHDDEKEDYWQLQYSQTIDLVFPEPTAVPGNPTVLIIWPHITVNTLRKVSDATEA